MSAGRRCHRLLRRPPGGGPALQGRRRRHGIGVASRAVAGVITIIIIVVVSLAGCRAHPRAEDAAQGREAGPQQPADAPAQPSPVVAEGKIICLAEALRREHGAQSPPIHDHVWALRVKPGAPADPARAPRGGVDTLVLLRTPLAEGLFADARLQGRDLVLHGRQFPGTGVLEVTTYEGLRDGTRVDLYYWCEVCAIKTASPGPCACCQGEVELRESSRR